ncbi:MAG: winged helix-turn-helix domain-containing protein [Candidatus Bathyarchaeota archaeon]|nr:winged helix-turn-helix domain-containing protein [Candidatus Bathyarchaeota archaeon]
MSEEDDTYSTIFTALKHPIRRKILRRLQSSRATYTELLNELTIENGLLNYHLESIRELVTKMEDGRYALNEFGRAGVQLLQRVEEPVTHATSLTSSRQSLLLRILSIAIIVILSFSTWSLYSSNQLLKSELVDQMGKVDTLQSYIQTLTVRAPSFEIIPSQAKYYVGDIINATFSYINPTNQTITVVPPRLIRYSGHYVGDNDDIIHGVISSIANSNFMGVTILPSLIQLRVVKEIHITHAFVCVCFCLFGDRVGEEGE